MTPVAPDGPEIPGPGGAMEQAKESASVEASSQWFAQQNMAKFVGKWVAVIGKAVVASGPDLKSVLEETRKMHPNKVPYIASVPQGPITA